jgi:hypothetical protein
VFHLKDSFTGGDADHYFAFGPSGDVGWTPVTGDWNGDGIDTIGLYQPDVSLFHLKNSFTPGASDQYFAFGPGNAGWIPLPGDWDGDGVDTIGLYQPDASLFHLKNTFTPGASDQYFAFGPSNANWTPLTGNWDGNFVVPPNPVIEFQNSNDSRGSDLDFVASDGLGVIPRQLTSQGLLSSLSAGPEISSDTRFVIQGFVGGGPNASDFDSFDTYTLDVAADAEVTFRLNGYAGPIGLSLNPGGDVLPDAGPSVREHKTTLSQFQQLHFQVDTTSTFWILNATREFYTYELIVDINFPG